MQINDIIKTAPPRDLFDGLIVFLRVAEHKNFRIAAEELGLSPSAAGQTIRQLEKRIGAPLLARTTRRVGLTEAGELLLPAAEQAVRLMESATRSLQHLSKTPGGTLRLTMPVSAARLISPLIVREFSPQYPELSIEIHADNRFADLIAEGFDAGIRMGEDIERDMIAVRLTPPFPFVIAASPAYLAAHGTPQKPEDLIHHRCIGFRHSNNATYRWEFLDGKRRYTIQVNNHYIANDMETARQIAEHGGGLCYAARPLLQDALEKQTLVPLLQDYLPETDGIFLYYPSRRQTLPKLQAFAEFARTHISQAFIAGAQS